MKSHSIALYTAEQTRELDRIAINEFDIPGYQLMTRAGEFAFQTLLNECGDIKHLGVVCGLGNNGGDGYVVARLARQAAIPVTVFQIGDIEKQKGDALLAYRAMCDSGIKIRPINETELASCSHLVDAIFGTGLQRKPEGEWRDAIVQLNTCGKTVLALDIPSGLHADTGQALAQDDTGEPLAVRATITTTFIAHKRGLYTGAGPHLSGKINYSDLQIPREVSRKVQATSGVWSEGQLSLFVPRARHAHKGVHGHVLLIGGEAGYSGAIRMAGEASLRCGAGLVSVATRSDHAALITQSRPELMCHGIEQPDALGELARRANVCVLGPGLSQNEWSRSLFDSAINLGLPKIVDADGLNLLAQSPQARQDWILTPHPGEAARLLASTVHEIEADRFAACEAIHRQYGGICVLKGAGTLIYDGNTFTVCTRGNPGMASGGSGDVLSGILGGVVAQYPNISLVEAATLGVGVHAMAGDLAAQSGERGMLASDIIGRIREVVNP
ncbi:MAG: NAD(P)H-hydrate dehydratase [Gammaproteobacteria bacterium]|nr:NAD(P)H-hydrate dehydratase [Gammaproteobacteria bacterium]